MPPWPHMSEIIPHGETLHLSLYEKLLLLAERHTYYPTLESRMLCNMLNILFAVQRITCYYQLWKIQKFIYSQTNPSPPPSCCIQADIWPVISSSVEETCGHLMTPTGVMHAIAQDGAMTAMTVSFNISLYILCEMRGTFKLLCFWLDNVHCLVSDMHKCRRAALEYMFD